MYTKKFLKGFGLLLVVALLLAVLPMQAKAETYDVCPAGCTYTSIQSAINAAPSGATITVGPGEYTEQLLIQKDLTLVGAGIGQTIVKAPTSGRATAPGYTSQYYSGDNWNTDYLLAAYPTNPVSGTPISVKVSGFTFDANGQGHIVGDRFTGVYFRKVFNSDISAAGLFDSEIKGFSASDPSVTGIRVLESSKLTLSGNLVKDYTILGIVVYGTDNLVDPIVQTVGNTLTPAGSAQGIQYRYINRVGSEGFAGVIAENTINGGSLPIAPAYSDNILVEDNVITNSADAGIVLEASSSCTIQENKITDFVYNGIQVAGSNHVIQGNMISDTTGFASNGIAVLSHLFPTGSSGNQIIGNTISGIHSGNTGTLGDCGWGIGVENYGGTVTNTIIEGNTVTGNDAGIVFYGVDATNVAHYNKLSGNTFADLGNSGSVTIDAMANWWGQATGPASGQIYGNASSNPWCTTEDCKELQVATGGSIQDAIDLVPAGGTVHVAAGTYNEDLEIGKSITLLGPNAEISPNTGTRVAEAIVAPIDETGKADPAILITSNDVALTVKGIKFDMGNTLDESDRFVESINKTGVTLNIEKNIFANAPSCINGNWYITGTTNPFSLTLKDNFFTGSKDSNGISLWGNGHTVDIQDNVWQDNGGWAVNFNNVSGTFHNNKLFDTEDNGPDWWDEQAGFLFASANNLTLTNNIFDGLPNPYIRIYDSFSGTLDAHNNTFKNAEDSTLGAIRISAGANLSGAKFENNSFINVPFAVQNLSTSNLDTSPNWWGNAAGPGASQVNGAVDFTPWCADEGCTTFAPDANGNVNLSGTVSVPGGILINEPGITYHLAANTVIQNSSPCFVVNASYTKIYAEPGAKCIPTGGANGIDVAAGLTDIRVKGLEIDGTDQSTGDGIHFAGVVTDVLLVDNFIHDLDGNGVYFGGQPAGVQDIHGNLFMNNTGKGIEASSFTVLAEFNSWGNYAGPTAGDGISSGVDAVPWTHVDLYLGTTDTPSPHYVLTGGEITYEIYGNFQNVIGADFSLKYPDGLVVKSTTPGTVFENQSILTTIPGKINFIGYQMGGSAVTGQNLKLFSVTFTAPATAATFAIDLDETTDLFSMAPTSEPSSSNNIYAAQLQDAVLHVVDPLSLTAMDLYESVNQTTWTKVYGTLASGYTMAIDPANEFEYLDAANPVVNRTLANGLHPFYLDTTVLPDGFYDYWEAKGVVAGATGWQGQMWLIIIGEEPMFYLKVNGTSYDLIDGLQGEPNRLRVSGDYPLGAYHFNGTVTDTLGFTDSVAVNITFIAPLSLTDIELWESVDLSTWTKVYGTLAGGYTMAIDPVNEFEYLDADNPTVNRTLANGLHPFTLDTSSLPTGFYAYWAAKGVTEDAVPGTWQARMWLIITGEEPMFYLKVDGDSYDLIDGLQGGTNPLRVSGDYPLGTYHFNGTLTDTFGYTGGVDVSITFIEPLSLTAMDLYESVNQTNWTKVYGSLASGYTMAIDPANEFEYLDAANPVVNRTLANGLHPFYLDTTVLPDGFYDYWEAKGVVAGATGWQGQMWLIIIGEEPMFYLKVNGTSYDLIDGLQGEPNRLRVSGDYPLGTYHFIGTVKDIYDATDSVQVQITFVGTYTVTGTFSMQGRNFRGGIPVTLTAQTLPYGPFAGETLDLLSNNLVIEHVSGDTYLITTNQDRYLNLTTASVKYITVDGAKTLNALMLRGGNVNNDAEIGLADAGIIGGVYGSTGDPQLITADANFDGRVNILDLALVGGNYNLTTASAYTTWLP